MAEELLARFGCSIVMFGRTDLVALPAAVLDMDDATFAAYQPQFYREEMVRRPGAKMVEHKRAFEQLQAAHEIRSTLRRLSALPGRVEYVALDITDAAAVDREVARLARRTRPHRSRDARRRRADVDAARQAQARRLAADARDEAVRIAESLRRLPAVRAATGAFPHAHVGVQLHRQRRAAGLRRGERSDEPARRLHGRGGRRSTGRPSRGSPGTASA